MTMYVSLFVCVFVWLSARPYQEPHVRTSPNILFMLPVAVVWSSSRDTAVCYVLPVLLMTSFSYNRSFAAMLCAG